MLQRTYPGQLPPVRRDCFNLVLPIDFTSSEDVRLVADTFLSFVKRKLTIRIGLVPTTSTPAGAEQARVIYHLLETYGLSSVFAYLEASYLSKSVAAASKGSFDSAVDGKKLRLEMVPLSFEEVLKSEVYDEQIQASRSWIRRLSADSKVPPMFVDGAAIPRDENYLQSMSTRVHYRYASNPKGHL